MNDPLSQTTDYYVLLMTATVVKCDAVNETEAIQRALYEAPRVIDPTQLAWVAKYASTTPITLAEEGEEPAQEPTSRIITTGGEA